MEVLVFFHIGDNVSIYIRDVIAIFDLETTTTTRDTREFLKIAEEEGFVVTVSVDMPKSFIITEKNGQSMIYLSPISSATLKKRVKDLLQKEPKNERGRSFRNKY